MKVLYFAWVREKVGLDIEEVSPPDTVLTVGDLAAWLSTRSPGHKDGLSDLSRLRAAVDQDLAQPDSPVTGVAEVAFFPPMTGG
ncbi:MAG: molybdopterin converting factor subunit 1 [Rhodospirillum sp.]|nr:molybdopterin converting factor subunit 1 [Rhodospirillum sp.]MCF8490060.1 molybdopterin converting factor subunit 1 [Rhodospirillum sp.]MCF8499535.1 molybdopterin converting factor subunit 1 [Rhodospirillum sp.]